MRMRAPRIFLSVRGSLTVLVGAINNNGHLKMTGIDPVYSRLTPTTTNDAASPKNVAKIAQGHVSAVMQFQQHFSCCVLLLYTDEFPRSYKARNV